MSKHAPKPVISHSKPKSKIAAKQGAGTKPAYKIKPTAPNHEFPQPYSRLLLIGEHELEAVQGVYEEIATTLKAGDPHEAVARLTAIALDESYYEYYDIDHPNKKETRPWTRLHAIGVLSFMGEAASAAIELLLPLLDEEDDWLREEMPVFYASTGEAAIEPLRRLLHDPEADTYMRTGAGDSLEQIAETHPALRPAIIPLLEQALVNAAENELLAAFLVCNLLDLNAKESLGLIQQAFEEERVDESVVEIRDVEEHFGLVPMKADIVKLAMRSSALQEEQNTASWQGAAEDEALPLLEEEGAAEASMPYVKPVKLGRNEPCWCGSGKKFKQCHG